MGEIRQDGGVPPTGSGCQPTASAPLCDGSSQSDIPNAGLVVVPRDAPEEMWGGLARDIMMWLGFDQPTPAKLFHHLTCCGKKIPAWLSDEFEEQALDHVPSKGTRCVLIYRAMVEGWIGRDSDTRRMAETTKIGSVRSTGSAGRQASPNPHPHPTNTDGDANHG